MRHLKRRNSLSMKDARRAAMLNNMAASMVRHNRIITTHKKAKVASQFIDKLITLAKRGDLHAQRQLFAYLKSRTLVRMMITEVAPRFAARSGGYTRVIKYKHRPGDGAMTALLEFTELPVAEEKKDKKKADKKSSKKKKSVKDGAAGDEPAKEAKKSKAKAKEKSETDTADENADEKSAEKEEKKGFFDNLRGYLKK